MFPDNTFFFLFFFHSTNQKRCENTVVDGQFNCLLYWCICFQREKRGRRGGLLRLQTADSIVVYSQGMDLDVLRKSSRFAFVDGLTGFYAPPPPPPSSSHSAAVPNDDGVITGPGDGRTAADVIKKQVDGALSCLSPPPRKRILLVDGLDAYVAMTPPGSASEADSLLMGLREVRFPPFPLAPSPNELLKRVLL